MWENLVKNLNLVVDKLSRISTRHWQSNWSLEDYLLLSFEVWIPDFTKPPSTPPASEAISRVVRVEQAIYSRGSFRDLNVQICLLYSRDTFTLIFNIWLSTKTDKSSTLYFNHSGISLCHWTLCKFAFFNVHVKSYHVHLVRMLSKERLGTFLP